MMGVAPTISRTEEERPSAPDDAVVMGSAGPRIAPQLLLLIASAGLPIVAAADALSRRAMAGAEPLFWAGLLVIALPLIAGVLSRDLGRGWRLTFVVLLSFGIYVADVMGAPLRFIQLAELDQLRTLDDIGATGHLFSANPLAQVSPGYPGLSTITNAVSELTGASSYASGVMIISLCRLVLAAALFRLFELVSGSSRLAGIATVVYATNPNFLLFSTQFSYESVGLPLMVLVLMSLAKLQRDKARSFETFALAIPLAAALVITHHITSFILVATLAAWTLISLAVRSGRRVTIALATFTAFTALCVWAWLSSEGHAAATYLGSIIGPAIDDLVNVLTFSSGAKTPFEGSGGVLAPAWERYAGFASIAVLLIALPFGLRYLWLHYRRSAAALLLGAIALAYPASLALRLTQAGTEASNRASDFVFIGLGLVTAFVVGRLLLPDERSPNPRRERTALVAGMAGAVVLFVGGITIGTPPYARQPGTYKVGADSQSVESSVWTRLPGWRPGGVPGTRFSRTARTGRCWAPTGGRSPRLVAPETFRARATCTSPG